MYRTVDGSIVYETGYKCLLPGEGVNKLWYLHAKKYYTVVKTNGPDKYQLQISTQMNLTNAALTRKSKLQQKTKKITVLI